jgi:putative DNA primase/helicase
MIEAERIERARETDIVVVAEQLGAKLKGRVNRFGPCPICGGTDRFSIHTRKQVWNCRGCAKGGGAIDLVMHVKGLSFGEAIDDILGEEISQPRPRPSAKPKRRVSAADPGYWQRCWNDARPVRGTLAQAYLQGRGIHALPPLPDEVLRFHPEACFGEAEDGTRREAPCLLALVRDVVSNKPIGLQRIGLTPDGSKLDRLALGEISGGAVKLWNDAEVSRGLVIAEGVETALAAAAIEWRGTLLQPIWATLFAGNMRGFPVLAGIEALTLIVDADLPDRHGRCAGQEAAAVCAQRWQAAGREVIRLTPREVRI